MLSRPDLRFPAIKSSVPSHFQPCAGLAMVANLSAVTLMALKDSLVGLLRPGGLTRGSIHPFLLCLMLVVKSSNKPKGLQKYLFRWIYSYDCVFGKEICFVLYVVLYGFPLSASVATNHLRINPAVVSTTVLIVFHCKHLSEGCGTLYHKHYISSSAVNLRG